MKNIKIFKIYQIRNFNEDENFKKLYLIDFTFDKNEDNNFDEVIKEE